MNLTNKLTMMRVIMVPFFMVFAAMSHMGTPQFNATYALIAGILFAVASFTDFLDGYLARKNHYLYGGGRCLLPRGAGHHHVPRVCCGRCAHDCGRVRYRHCRKHVGQGQNRTADGHHHLLLLCHGARPGGRRWGYQLYLCWAVAAVTALSGCIYLWQNRSCFMQAK